MGNVITVVKLVMEPNTISVLLARRIGVLLKHKSLYRECVIAVAKLMSWKPEYAPILMSSIIIIKL